MLATPKKQFCASNEFQPEIVTEPVYYKGGDHHKEECADKDDTLVIDMSQVRHMIQRMHDIQSTKIVDLKGQDDKYFKDLVMYVDVLYDTETFKTLHQEIENKFKNIDKLAPGTVGAYFGGCLLKKNHKHDLGCGAVCAGSVPLPKDNPMWKVCKNSVILATWDQAAQKYSLAFLHVAESKDDVIVYVDAENGFRGFTQQDVQKFLAHDIQKVTVVAYDSKSGNYHPLLGGQVPIRSQKLLRAVEGGTAQSVNPQAVAAAQDIRAAVNKDYIVWGLIIILVILAIWFSRS